MVYFRRKIVERKVWEVQPLTLLGKGNMGSLVIRFWTGFDKTLVQTTFVRVLHSTPVFSARCRPWDGLHRESGSPCVHVLDG